MKWMAGLVAGITALLMVGCATSSIDGRVLPGAAAVVTLVDNNDTRLTTQGIPGVEVEIKSVDRAGDSHVIGTVTTDEQGAFTLPLSDEKRKLVKNSMVLTARRNGIPAVKENIMLPGQDRKLLVLMPQLGKAPGSK